MLEVQIDRQSLSCANSTHREPTLESISSSRSPRASRAESRQQRVATAMTELDARTRAAHAFRANAADDDCSRGVHHAKEARDDRASLSASRGAPDDADAQPPRHPPRGPSVECDVCQTNSSTCDQTASSVGTTVTAVASESTTPLSGESHVSSPAPVLQEVATVGHAARPTAMGTAAARTMAVAEARNSAQPLVAARGGDARRAKGGNVCAGGEEATSSADQLYSATPNSSGNARRVDAEDDGRNEEGAGTVENNAQQQQQQQQQGEDGSDDDDNDEEEEEERPPQHKSNRHALARYASNGNSHSGGSATHVAPRLAKKRKSCADVCLDNAQDVALSRSDERAGPPETPTREPPTKQVHRDVESGCDHDARAVNGSERTLRASAPAASSSSSTGCGFGYISEEAQGFSYVHQTQKVFKASGSCASLSNAGAGHGRAGSSSPAPSEWVFCPSSISAANGASTPHAATASGSAPAPCVSSMSAGVSPPVPALPSTPASPSLAVPLTESRVARDGIAAFLSKICQQNKGAPIPSSDFHSHCEPPMTVRLYVERLEKYCSCSGEALLCGLMLLLKYTVFSGHPVTIYNAHRLLITSTVLGIKMRDDVYYNNVYYARIGGISAREMNKLEVIFLARLNWELNVSPEAYAELRAILAKLTEDLSERQDFLQRFARQHPEVLAGFDPEKAADDALALASPAPVPGESVGPQAQESAAAREQQRFIEAAYRDYYWRTVVEPWIARHRELTLAHADAQGELEQHAWATEERKWADYRQREEEESLSSDGSSRWMSPATVACGNAVCGFPSVPAVSAPVIAGTGATRPAAGATAPHAIASSARYANFVRFSAGNNGSSTNTGSKRGSQAELRYANLQSASGGERSSAESSFGIGMRALEASACALQAATTATAGSSSSSGGDGGGNSSKDERASTTSAAITTAPARNSGSVDEDDATATVRGVTPGSGVNVNAQPYYYTSRRAQQKTKPPTAEPAQPPTHHYYSTQEQLEMEQTACGGGDRNNFATSRRTATAMTTSTTALTAATTTGATAAVSTATASSGVNESTASGGVAGGRSEFAANTFSTYNLNSNAAAPHIRFTNWRSSNASCAPAKSALSTAEEQSYCYPHAPASYAQVTPSYPHPQHAGSGRAVLHRGQRGANSSSSGGGSSHMNSNGGGHALSATLPAGPTVGRKRPKPDSYADRKYKE